MFIANYLVLLPDRITLTGTLWLNPWRVSHINTGTNQSAFFLRDSTPSGPRHPSCNLLQDSGCDNIEKDLRIEFSELQEAQWVSSSKVSSKDQ